MDKNDSKVNLNWNFVPMNRLNEKRSHLQYKCNFYLLNKFLHIGEHKIFICD